MRGSGGRRGPVVGFSEASRRRARFVLRNAHARWQALVTLTYPSAFPDGVQAKRHLNAFLTLLRKRYPGLAYFWVLEHQRRGAPHFHLLLSVRVPKRWLSQAWAQIVRSGDSRHVRAGTRVEAPRSQRGARRYLLKYLTKGQTAHLQGWTGRYWGASRGLASPVDSYAVDLTLRDVGRLLRPLRRWYRSLCRSRGWRFRWRWGLSPRGHTLYEVPGSWVLELVRRSLARLYEVGDWPAVRPARSV